MDEEISPRPLVESSTVMHLDMNAARQLAVDEAYNIAIQTREDARTYRWSCPSVKLESLNMGSQVIPVYHIAVILAKRGGLFSLGGKRRFEFQLEAMSGNFIGLEDHGWEEW
jgi:hypothetical protein